jgi:hypothetical protein
MLELQLRCCELARDSLPRRPRSRPRPWGRPVVGRGWWRRGRSPRRRGTGEFGLDAREQPGQRVGLGRRERGEQLGESLAQERLGREKRLPAGRGEGERLASAVAGDRLALEQAGVVERGEQLRDGGPGDSGAPRELAPGHALAADRPQRQVLGDGQCRVMAGEQALDPAADQRGDGDEPIGGLGGRVVVVMGGSQVGN